MYCKKWMEVWQILSLILALGIICIDGIVGPENNLSRTKIILLYWIFVSDLIQNIIVEHDL